jgi:hypothetical protein
MKLVLILIVYILANMGSSHLFLRVFSKSLAKDLPLSIQFALGAALLSTLWLFLGLGGGLKSIILWPIILILALPAIWRICNFLKTQTGFSLKHRLRESYKNPFYFLLLVGAVGLVCWFGFLAYIRPPTEDAAAFYLVYPKVIAATGKLIAMPGLYNTFSTIGLNGELHFAILMVIGSSIAAKLFAWVVGIGILFLLRDITRQVGGEMVAQVTAVIMLLTSITFCAYLSDGKTDLFSTFLGLASLYAILLIPRISSSRLLLIMVSGMLTGFAMVAKFSYIIAFFPATILLLILQEIYSKAEEEAAVKYKSVLRSLILFGIGVFIGLFPHLLKNGILFGNPLVPFFGLQYSWTDQSNWYSWKDTLWIVATYPAALVFGIYPLMGGNISVLWLAAFGLILFVPKGKLLLRNPVMQLTLSGCIGLLCWIATKASVFVPRYFLTTLIMLIPLPAIAVEYAWQHEVRPRLVSFSFFLFTAAIIIITPMESNTGLLNALIAVNYKNMRHNTAECAIETPDFFPYCDGFSDLNKKAEKGDRLFVVGYYTYWLRPDLLLCINDASDFTLLENSSPEEIWSAIYDQGFKHVAVQKMTHKKYLARLDPSQTPKWLHVSSEFNESDMPIFHLKATEPPKKPHVQCNREGEVFWHLQKMTS